MKINSEKATTIRVATMALITALVAFNNHWTITIGFIYILFTLEIQGKVLLDMLQDVLTIIGKLKKLEDSNLDKK